MQTAKIIIEDGRLEQFNEEVVKEFADKLKKFGPSNSKNNFWFNKFITQKLTEHKALILKMVREMYREHCKECGFLGRKECEAAGVNVKMVEFLNNLDTI